MASQHALIDSAIALQPLLALNAKRMEQERRLAPEVLSALHAMKAFNLQLSKEYNGPGADLITHLRVIEELSRGDASTGWCAMVGSESSACVNAYLAPEIIREMLVDIPEAVVAFTAVGMGRAVETPGGYNVSGRWRFTSGCHHAAWIGGLCSVYAGDVVKLRDNGAPFLRLIFAPIAEVEVIDTWHTSGLQGTASDDVQINTCFIPQSRTMDLFTPPRDSAPVWRIPLMLRLAMSKAAAICGMARSAMDAALPLLQRTPMVGGRPAREEARVQLALAQAEAAIEGGRAYFYQNSREAWDIVQSGQVLDIAAIAKVRLAVVFAAQRALDAVRLIQDFTGSAAIFDAKLDRAIRDINVARHHLQLQSHVVEDVGRVLLGLAPRNPLF